MEATMESPSFQVSRAIATTEFDKLYASLKPKGVTVSALLAKAVALTLEKHPIINAGYDTSADIWSLACMVFELVTGDYLFDPKVSEEYPRDEDHLALFVELLGSMPIKLIARGRRSATYFNRRGDLRHIKSLRYWGLPDVLQQKYHMHPLDARNLASFLLPMLRLLTDDRITAKAALEHPWLQGLPSLEVTEYMARTILNTAPPSEPPPPARGGAKRLGGGERGAATERAERAGGAAQEAEAAREARDAN